MRSLSKIPTIGRKGILLFWALCSALADLAQPRSELYFQSLQQGLSNQVVSCIYQDHEGFMWFGTQGGLNRYDGTNFIAYENNPPLPGSISHSIINAILEDQYHNLWIGTATGLNRYNREKDNFEFLELKKNKPIYVTSLYSARDGRLMIGTSGSGLYTYDPLSKKLSAYIHDPRRTSTLCSDFVTSVLEDKNNNLWIGTRNGLDMLASDRQTFTHFVADPADARSLSHNMITSLKADRHGTVWIGTYGGGINQLVSTGGNYNFVHFVNNANPGSLSYNYVLTLLPDRRGDLWVGTENGGLNRMRSNTTYFEHYNNKDGDPQSISSNSIWSLYEDKEDLLWIGTYSKGLAIYDESFTNFKRYQRNTFDQRALASNNVKGFSEDQSGNLWIATDGGGVSYFDTRQKVFSTPIDNSGLSNKAVQAVLCDRDQNIWVGTWGSGLDRYSIRHRKIRNYHFEENSKSGRNNVKCIYQDRSGEIFVGTSGSGLFHYNKTGDIFEPITDPTHSSHLGPTSFINAILETADQNLWVGTSYGLVKITRKGQRNIAFNCLLYDGQPRNGRNYISVNTLCEDQRRQLWIGSGDHLALLDRFSNRFTLFDKQTGLPDNTINAILEDRPGILWISTNKGIFSFDIKSHKIHSFEKDDGLVTNEFFPGSCIRTKDGELFFGGNNGFSSFIPDRIQSNRKVPPVYITGFELFNIPAKIGSPGSPLIKSITETKAITLNDQQNSFSVEFAALNFLHPQKNSYAYILEGFDKNWTQAGTRHTATYTNMDPGDYIFKVKGSNNEDFWNDKPVLLKIRVLPPYWKTPWAYLSYVLIIAGLVWAFIKMRITRIAQSQKLKLEHDHRTKVEELIDVKTQFFTNVSHELRTPLSLILAPLEQIISMSGLTRDVKTKLGLVYHNAGKLYELVNELMDFSKLEDRKLKLNVAQHDLVKFSRDLYTMFTAEAERLKIDYRFSCEQTEIMAWYDPGRMKKVIINLIDNAFNYVQEGGYVQLHIQKSVTSNLTAPGKESVSIMVTDNGSGISQQHLSRIFDRFFQCPENSGRRAGGTGIGLALVKNLVELHGGTVSASSERGVRTCFAIELPLGNEHFEAGDLDMEPYREDLRFKPASGILLSKKCEPHAPLLLIAEDNSELRAYLAAALSANYRVLEAVDGDQAYTIAESKIPDLIISDVLMPDCGGLEFCKKLRSCERTAHIPLILLTATTTNSDQVTGMISGADAYITKPFSIDVLMAQVSRIISSRRELYAHFSQQVYFRPQNNISETEDYFIKKATGYILANLESEELGVESMSEALNLSRSNLFRRVKATTGRSVIDFIRIIRLKEAIKFMESGKYTIAEIAYRTGFRSPAYFTKSFKEQYGKPPSEFIKKTSVK